MTTRTPHRNASGVYAAPADASAWRAAHLGKDDVWRVLDLSPARDKADLLRGLAHALDFAPDFGHNWDALADALQDLSWLQSSRIVLELTGGDAFQRNAPEAWRTALDIFRDAATYWSSRRRVLLVLVHGASHLPALQA